MNSYNVRKLTASEIEVKPCQVAKDKSWVQILLYKTSRVDMQILTEMYGQKWKSEYKMVGDSLFCTISVYDSELNEWISRTDCGEKDAGLSEDKSWATSAFKRAATQFGIGIELYSTPRIKFPTKSNWFYNDKLNMAFQVSEIEWVGETLAKLTIVDRFGNVVWTLGQKEQIQMPQQERKPVERKTNNSVFVITEKPENVNTMLPRYAFAKISNTQNMNDLKGIWDANPNWQGNNNFKSLLTKRKTALGAAY